MLNTVFGAFLGIVGAVAVGYAVACIIDIIKTEVRWARRRRS